MLMKYKPDAKSPTDSGRLPTCMAKVLKAEAKPTRKTKYNRSLIELLCREFQPFSDSQIHLIGFEWE